MLKEEIAEVVTEKKKKRKKKEVTVRMERGVETMFRVTYSNHSQISSMADSKSKHPDFGHFYQYIGSAFFFLFSVWTSFPT